MKIKRLQFYMWLILIHFILYPEMIHARSDQPSLLQRKVAIIKAKQYCQYLSDICAGNIDAMAYLRDLLEMPNNTVYDDITGKNNEVEFSSFLSSLVLQKNKFKLECLETTQLSDLLWCKSSWPKESTITEPADIIVVPVKKNVNGNFSAGILALRAYSGKIVNYYHSLPENITTRSFSEAPPTVLINEVYSSNSFLDYEEEIDGVKIEMAAIKGSAFSKLNAPRNFYTKQPECVISLSDFYMSKTDITNEEYCKFLNENACNEKEVVVWIGLDEVDRGGNKKEVKCFIYKDKEGYHVPQRYLDYPVMFVTWYGANEFCKWLSEKTGKDYRLPTDAEWEFCAMGGEFGLSDLIEQKDWIDNPNDYSWSDYNSGYKVHPVAKKLPNPLGLYDMLGNIQVWCADWWYDDSLPCNSDLNPAGPETGNEKIVRGYNYDHLPYFSRLIDCRISLSPENSHAVGFRITCSR